MNLHAVAAIFKRNFNAYFAVPIGYVFICAFVLLSAFAAFWPNEFFNANLANLDQLNERLPWIMLVFIPAITMSVWAEERRQGTDELLLTLPASDLDTVAGKYLAVLAIFTVSLIFSMSNLLVLIGLGTPDLGLLAANYVGYWLVGAAMLAVGMVASFLTANLTVGFILGAAFNAPLVFAAYADTILERPMAPFIEGFSIAEQFADFGRGVLPLSGVVFFASITAVMLYLSMILIGRRHWAGGPEAPLLTAHFAVRALSLAAVGVGINVLALRFDVRLDTTSEGLNSLSHRTVALLDRLDPQRPVLIDAYVSPEVPEEYVQTRLNLLSMLQEVDSRGGDNVIVNVHQTARFSEEADEAQQQFGITARPVQSSAGGSFSVEQIFLGVAFRSGLDKVVVPFFDVGLPVEYEIIRSVATVSQQQRRTVGILSTDARLYGGFDMQTMGTRPNQPIVTELEKQYDVVRVDAGQPITTRYDALLAVQPSSLPAGQMQNFIDAVADGQPTAIFEDPLPLLDPSVAATGQPRVPPGGNNPFRQQQPPEPKGDISRLWQVLGIQVPGDRIIWQEYNPHPKLPEIPNEFVFIGAGSGEPQAFNSDSEISRGLQEMLLVFPGALHPQPGAEDGFTGLLRTGERTGELRYDQMMQRSLFGSPQLNPNRRYSPTGLSYTLAAHVRRQALLDAPNPAGDDDEAGSPSDAADPPSSHPISAVVVADIDMLYPVFFRIRQRGNQAGDQVSLNLDNVTFVLNALDHLAGDDRFIAIRRHRPVHRTLTTVERQTEQARAEASRQREEFIEQFEQSRAEAEQQLERKIQELRAREGVDPQQMILEVTTAQRVEQQRLDARIERLERQREREIERIERELALTVSQVQDRYKFVAVALPPIPPLLVAIVVYLRRRSLERLGVPRARLKI